MLAVSIASGLDYVNFAESSLVYNLAPGTPVSQQLEVLRAHVGADEQDSFRLLTSTVDQLGIAHDRYQQMYAGIDVAGGVYTVHSASGQITSLSGKFIELGPDTPIYAGLGTELAAARAIEYMDQRAIESHGSDILHVNDQPKRYVQDDPALAELVGLDGPLAGELVYYTTAENQVELVYRFDLYVIEPVVERTWVFVNADTGQIEGDLDRIHAGDVPASGTSLYDGTVNFTADEVTGSPTIYRLRQSGEGVETYDLNNATTYGGAVDFENATDMFVNADLHTGVQAHWGTENTLRYFFQTFGRDSFDDAGTTLRSYVSYGTNYVNAFWNGSFMTYGDGNGTTWGPLVSLDVVGHEIAHGVTEYSANLIYSYESGALNESFSDIFGEAVERFARGTNDWAIGGDFDLVDGDGFRSMSNPNSKGDPDTYQGDLWWTSAGDNGGVHVNSGVQNKWFYILTVGEAGVNDHGFVYDVTGIGMDDAEAIAYRNLTNYLTPGSTFQDAREGAIQAAIDLFGYGSQQHISTDEAWEAVGLYATGTEVEFTQLAPQGSLIYDANYSGAITGSNPSDLYTINLDGNQQLTVIVEGDTGGLVPQVTWFDTLAVPMVVPGPSIDNTTIVQTLDATAAGEYQVLIEGTAGSTGTYDVRFLLNSDVELETWGLGDNGSLASAVSLEPSAIALGLPATSSADRLATLGFVTPETGGGGGGGGGSITEDFESGILDSSWTTYSSHPGGQIEVTDAYGAASGSFALVMQQTAFGTYNLNEAVYTVDLNGLASPFLNFDHVSFGDENDRLPANGFFGHYNGDGVSISEDGLAWYPVLTDVTPPNGIWESVSIDLEAAATTFGITLGSEFRIKFQQYDNYGISFADGRAFDNISLGPPAAPVEWNFDFGPTNSPVAAGYIPVHRTTLYNAVDGYGYTDPGTVTADIADTVGTDLERDWVRTTFASFAADVPNGDYEIELIFGNRPASQNSLFDIEGTPVVLTVTNNSSYITTATVTDGQFNLTLDANGAPVNYAFLAGLRITEIVPVTSADWYSFDLTAGQRASVAATLLEGATDVAIELYDATETLLTSGIAGTQVQSWISQFAAPTDATYYVRVTGDGDYSLVVTRNAEFDFEAGVQNITAVGGALGHVRELSTAYAEPDDFNDGAILDVAIPGVVLSNGIVNSVYAALAEFVPPTGNHVFAPAPGADAGWNDSAGNVLRATFTNEQAYVSIDVGSDDNSDSAVLRAYDFAGNLLEQVFSGGVPNGGSETIFIRRATNEISYVEATGIGGNITPLDRLVFKRISSDTDTYTINAEMGQLIEVAGYLPGGGSGQFENLLGEGTSNELRLDLIDPNLVTVASGVDVLSHTAQIPGVYRLVVSANDESGEYFVSLDVSTPVEWNFDFGPTNSPVAAGYIPVHRTTLYNAVDGYGYTDPGTVTADIADTVGTDLERDWVRTTFASFAADVPNGDYEIELIFGNRPASQNSLFDIEGTPVVLTVTNNSSYITTATVTDGQFNLTLDANGAPVNYAFLAGLRITEIATVTGGSGAESFAGGVVVGDPVSKPDFATAELIRRQSTTRETAAVDWKCLTPVGKRPTSKPGYTAPVMTAGRPSAISQSAWELAQRRPQPTTVDSLTVGQLDQVFAKSLDELLAI